MHPLQKLLSATVLYGLSSVVGRVLNYLLVPFYTSIFLPADYGLLTEWYAYAAFLQILYTYGMETTYFRFAQEHHHAFDLAVSTLLTSSLLYSGLLIWLATPIATALAHPGSEHYVYYLAAILTVDTLLVIPFAQLRLQNRALFFATTKLLQIGLNITLNIVLLYGCAHIYTGQWLPAWQPWVSSWYDPTQKVAYVLLANLVANAAALPLLSPSLARLRFQLPWHQLRPMLTYALPLLFTGLASTTNEMLSRAMLRHWLPPGFYPGQSNEAILGIFGACYKFSVFMLLAIQAFRYAAEPFFFAHARQHNAPQLFSTLFHWFVLAACFILFAVSANLDLLASLLLRKAAYRAALPIVPYLLLAYLLLGLYYNLSVWCRLTDKTHYSALLTALGAFITLILNALLIPQMGYWGSVWAAIASYATMAGLCYYWGQQHYPIPYQLGRAFLYITGTGACIYLLQYLSYPSYATTILGNLMLTFLFGLLLYGLGRSQDTANTLPD